MDERGWRARVTRLATDENLELWLLAGAAAVFTVLGIVGVAGQQILASAILALLALLAVAQLRSRREVAQLSRSAKVTRTDLLLGEFPADLLERRDRAHDVLLIGTTLARTMTAYRSVLLRPHTAPRRVRVLVADPTLVDALARVRPAYRQTLERLRNMLTELGALAAARPDVEVRVAPIMHAAGVNVCWTPTPPMVWSSSSTGVRAARGTGAHRRTQTPGRTLVPALRREAERLWAAAMPWPSPVQRLGWAPPAGSS